MEEGISNGKKNINQKTLKILGWPKSSFGFFHRILGKNPNEFFGQPNISFLKKQETNSLLYFFLSLMNDYRK